MPNFPYPDPQPLKRLHIHDGLTINAARWEVAHSYHRQRQNIHFQALHQPGIVSGLGVRVIDPPSDSSSQLHNSDKQESECRWIEIQPGLAIDLKGNPIIVNKIGDRDLTYRIAADATTREKQIIYVVVSFVEPDDLEQLPQPPATFLERFRFDQKTSPPDDNEVEICRIQLEYPVWLSAPDHVFSPKANQLDFRYRVPAQFRPQAHVRVGWLKLPEANRSAQPWQAPEEELPPENLTYLVRSLPALYPALSGEVIPTPIDLSDKALPDCDAIYTIVKPLLALSPSKLNQLKRYLKSGGTVLLEMTEEEDVPIAHWLNNMLDIPANLRFGEQNTSTQSSDYKQIKTQPFVFAALPNGLNSSLEIQTSSGIIWIRGNLSAAWGVQANLPRHQIRDAQEFGVNLLHYAWKRKQLTQLSAENPVANNP